jgi:hypothetical protein
MAGGTEMAALAGESQQIFMAAVLAFHAGKTVVQIAAIEITADHLFHIRSPESILMRKLFVIDLDEGFKIVFDASVIIG